QPSEPARQHRDHLQYASDCFMPSSRDDSNHLSMWGQRRWEGSHDLPESPPSHVTSLVEVGIEDSDAGNAVDRELVALRGAADRLRAGAVVNTEGLPSVLADVGMHPGHADLGVAIHDTEAGGRALLGHRDCQTVRKGSFDHVS